MGTRADFYIGRGEKAEWIGSIGFDGYPTAIDSKLLKAKTEDAFKKSLKSFASKRDDWTAPKDGWPWPWEDSKTTDYAYAFDKNKVYGSCFGHAWFDPLKDEPDHDDSKPTEFPDMTKKQNVAPYGSKKSGGIMIAVRK